MQELKVIIIDDEIHAIQHLKRNLSKHVPYCEIIASFTNPTIALKSNELHKADIIFVDIMMPIMDGLTFCDKAKQLNNIHAQFILLTAYRDFEFAQKAMKIGVYEYWVKHELQSHNIVEQMKRVTDGVLEAKHIAESLRHQKVLDVLDGKSKINTLFSQKAHKAFYILITGSVNEIPLSIISLPKYVDIVGTIKINQFHLAILAVSEYVSDMDMLHILNKEATAALIQGGLLSSSINHEYIPPDFLSTLFDAASNYTFGNKQILLANSGLLALLKYDLMLISQMEETYFSLLKKGLQACNPQAIQKSLDAIWKDEKLQKGNKKISEYTTRRINMLFNAAGLTINECSGSIEELKNMCNEIILSLKGKQEDLETHSIKVRRIRSYIHSHLGADLRLKVLSQEFNISGDHLRKLFKSETGISLSEYVTKARIETAIELLKAGNYKVYEIAELVGYRSTHYFSQAFFNTTGYYPTAYDSLDDKEP